MSKQDNTDEVLKLLKEAGYENCAKSLSKSITAKKHKSRKSKDSAPKSPALEVFAERIAEQIEAYVQDHLVSEEPASRLAEAVAHIVHHLHAKGYKTTDKAFHDMVYAKLEEDVPNSEDKSE